MEAPPLTRWSRTLGRPTRSRLVALTLAGGLASMLLGATRPNRSSPPLLGAGLLGNQTTLAAVSPDAAAGAAYVPGSTVLRLADGRLRHLPPGAAEPVTVAADDPAALAAVARERAWLAAGTVPGAAAEREAAAASLLFLRLLVRPGGAALAAQTPYWAYVWPRDASFVAAALAVTGHRAEAAAILGFLARSQRPDGTWPARCHPDGRPVTDGRPSQLDATGWVPWAAWLASDQGRDRPLAARLWPTVRAAADVAAGSLDATGLPPAGADYWERREHAPTLGTAAALRVGLRAAARLAGRLGDAGRQAAWSRAAGRLDRAVRERFGPTRYQRHPHGGGPDAAVAWLAPPFAPPDPVVRAAVAAAWRRLGAGGGAVPGRPWLGSDPWTPATASFALAAMAGGDRPAAEARLAWLLDHRTALGAFPERVAHDDGAPRSVAPLAWTHAIVLLTLVSREGRVPTP